MMWRSVQTELEVNFRSSTTARKRSTERGKWTQTDLSGGKTLSSKMFQLWWKICPEAVSLNFMRVERQEGKKEKREENIRQNFGSWWVFRSVRVLHPVCPGRAVRAAHQQLQPFVSVRSQYCCGLRHMLAVLITVFTVDKNIPKA